ISMAFPHAPLSPDGPPYRDCSWSRAPAWSKQELSRDWAGTQQDLSPLRRVRSPPWSFVRVPLAEALLGLSWGDPRAPLSPLVVRRATPLRVLASAPSHPRVRDTNSAADPRDWRGNTSGCPRARMNPALSYTHRPQAQRGLFAPSPKLLRAARR